MSSEAVEALRPAGDLKLHHVGFVVVSISNCAASFARSVGASWDGNIIFDPLQRVSVTFFHGRNAADPLIEFVEPADRGLP